jgi:nucleotide-binding universal stress UspA family protein
MVTKPVIVGVDGSEQSLLAAEWAAMEARWHRLPLRIVSAPAMMPRMIAYPDSPAPLGTVLRAVAAQALEAASARAEEVAPGLPVETGLLSGPVARAVARSGSEAFMLVVGARGAGGFPALILGSVSRYAAARAPCPIVVVRQETMAVHQEIAVGVRDPQDGIEALAFGFEEAAIRGADLVAVHAWSSPPSALHHSGEDEDTAARPLHPEQAPAEAASSLEAALDEWRNKYPDVQARHDVIRGHPADVLATYSARADLVVLGRHRSHGIRAGTGSIRHAVLEHAHGPVAVVPSGG